MSTEEDREFVEKLKTIGFVQKFKPGATHKKVVVSEDDGGVAGHHVEHHDGSQDAVAMPRVIEYKMGEEHMSNTERLEAELAIAKMVEEYEALRPAVEDKANQSPEDMARYRELNDAIAAARTAFKEQYPPPPPAEGDASPTPEPINAETH